MIMTRVCYGTVYQHMHVLYYICTVYLRLTMVDSTVLSTKMKAPFEPAPVTDPTLTPRVPRPQDIAYVETMRKQKAQEEAMQTMQTPQVNEETASKDLLKVLSHLATIITENRTASAVSDRSSKVLRPN
jgi:hypothetical protein